MPGFSTLAGANPYLVVMILRPSTPFFNYRFEFWPGNNDLRIPRLTFEVQMQHERLETAAIEHPLALFQFSTNRLDDEVDARTRFGRLAHRLPFNQPPRGRLIHGR